MPPDPQASSATAISVDGVQNLLESLHVAKAPGPDKIPTRILKLCASEIAPILLVIFIQSLNSGQIPRDRLTAILLQFFKKEDREDPSNYQPTLLIYLTYTPSHRNVFTALPTKYLIVWPIN